MTYEPVRLHVFASDNWERLADGTALVVCPGPAGGSCGWKVHLAVHAVDESGKVTPSVGHEMCGHHSWATLEGWEP